MLPCAVRLSKPERQSCSRKQDELSGIRGDRIMRAEVRWKDLFLPSVGKPPLPEADLWLFWVYDCDSRTCPGGNQGPPAD